MATARMIPAALPDGGAGVSAAERVLFREFARQLGPDWTVLHSVHWLAREGGRSRDGEADFLLAHPRHGVLVLEAKGGTIARHGVTQAWSSTDWGGVEHAIKDPFEQAERSLYALRDKLADAPETAGFSWRFARAVAFPDVLVGDADLGPNAPRALIVDSGDLATLARALGRAFASAPGGGPGPGADGVAALVRLLKPPVELQRHGLVGEMRRNAETFLRLTEQQYALLDFLGGRRRVAIDGAAGSGKTLLALEQCRRLARQGFRVLFTCYNKALAAWARAALAADLGEAMVLVSVDNYHDLAADLVRRAGLPVPDVEALDAAALARYFADELPEQLLVALAIVTERFDAIVVDEGQDFADTWWIALEALLADPDDGILAIFYDDNQRIYSTATSGAYPIAEAPFRLTRNCRTTRQIHQAALAYHQGKDAPDCAGPEGRPVDEAGSEGASDQPAALRRALHGLTAVEGVPVDAIVVLSTRGPKTSVLTEGLRVGNLALTWGEAGPGQLRVRSVHTYKGLESPVVILAEPDRAHAANRDALLYVALSRAQHHVVVLGTLPGAQG
jgi:NAD(P)-dependent dehydrogenase (short-subunit alcohol dehydrogenase family)